MKESIKITAPNLNPATPLVEFIGSITFLTLLGIGSLILPFLVLSLPLVIKIVALFLGLLLVYVVPFAIVLRFRANKQFALLDSNGITINYNGVKTTVGWDEISEIAVTFIVNSFNKGPHEGHPYFLVTLKNNMPPLTSIPVSYRGKDIFFVSQKNDYQGFVGLDKDFTFALNVKNAPEVDLSAFVSFYGKTFTTSRPFMEVSSNTEYNKLLNDMYSSEKISEYLLPE